MSNFNPEEQLRREGAWLRLLVRYGESKESFDHLARTGKPRDEIEEKVVAMVVNLCLAECGFRVEEITKTP